MIADHETRRLFDCGITHPGYGQLYDAYQADEESRGLLHRLLDTRTDSEVAEVAAQLPADDPWRVLAGVLRKPSSLPTVAQGLPEARLQAIGIHTTELEYLQVTYTGWPWNDPNVDWFFGCQANQDLWEWLESQRYVRAHGVTTDPYQASLNLAAWLGAEGEPYPEDSLFPEDSLYP